MWGKKTYTKAYQFQEGDSITKWQRNKQRKIESYGETKQFVVNQQEKKCIPTLQAGFWDPLAPLPQLK